MADAPYVRVYWSIRDDPKFATVYDNDRALATWLRLLIEADGMYPAPAAIPLGTSLRALDLLVNVGLVERVGVNLCRIRGLHAERQRRSARGIAGASARWSERNANALPTHSDRDAIGMLAEPSRAEHSKAEPSQAGPHTPRQLVHAWLADHGAAAPTGWANGTLNEYVKVYGHSAVIACWETAPQDVRTSRQLVQYLERTLAPTAVNGQKRAGGHTRTAQEGEDAFS